MKYLGVGLGIALWVFSGLIGAGIYPRVEHPDTIAAMFVVGGAILIVLGAKE